MSAKPLGFSGVLYTDRRDFYVDPQTFASLYPAVTPFLSMLMTKGFRDTGKDPDFKMFEYRAGWRHQYMSVNGSPSAWSNPGAGAGVTGATVTIDVDGVTGFNVNASLLNHRVEIFSEDEQTYKGVAFVYSVTDSNTVVLKAIGNAKSATEAMVALADNDKIYLLDTAFGEGTEAPEADSDELEVVWGSCQEQKTSVEVTEILQQSILRGAADELVRLREARGNAHKIKMSRGILLGYRPGGIGGVAHGAGGGTDSTFANHITDADGKTVRTSIGVIPAMRRYGRDAGNQQNWFSYARANMTYNDFVDIGEKVNQYNPGAETLTALVGPGAASFFNKVGAEGLVTKIAGARINIPMSDTKQASIGFNYREVQMGDVMVRFVVEETFRNTPYHYDMLFVNDANCQLMKFGANGGGQYSTNIKTDNNPRVIKDEFYHNVGVKLGLMESHTFIHLT